MKDPLLTKCLVCEEIGYDNEIQSWSLAFGLDSLEEHYIEHAKWKLFKDKHLDRLHLNAASSKKYVMLISTRKFYDSFNINFPSYI